MPNQNVVDRFVGHRGGWRLCGRDRAGFGLHPALRCGRTRTRRAPTRDGLVRHEQGMMSAFAITCEMVGAPLIAATMSRSNGALHSRPMAVRRAR